MTTPPTGTARELGWLVLLMAIAWTLRFGFAVWWQARLDGMDQAPFGFGDSDGYWRLAQSIAAGRPYAYPDDATHVFRAPGYPLLLAVPMWLTGGEPQVLVVRAWSALLASFAVGGVYWLGRQLYGTRVALLAAAIAAVYPGLVALGAFLLSDAPFAALVPVQLACWSAGWNSNSRRASTLWLLAAGIIAGLTSLVRPSWLLFTPFAIAIGIVCTKSRGKQLRAAPWLLLGLFLAMTPWWIRNYSVTGHFVPTTLQVGASLYDGQHPEATGGSDMRFVPVLAAQLRADDAAATTPPTDSFEYRFDRTLWTAATHWMRKHPGESLRLAAVKFSRLWNIWPNEPQFRSSLARIAVVGTYVPLLVLGLWGWWSSRRCGWPYQLLLLPAVYLTLLHIVFVSSIRYREPPMLLLFVPAAAKLLELIGRRSQAEA